MYLRIIDSPEGKIVAACERELVGRVLREGKIVLDLQKHAHFYRGEECTAEGLKSAFLGAVSINLVGRRCVECAISEGLAQKEDILLIEKVPHLQIYRIK